MTDSENKCQGDKCQAVYKASLELIAEQGFHGTPMSQIAKRAGVAVGSIYRYFKDKDELIHGVHKVCDEKMVEALADAHIADSSEKEQFLALMTTLTGHLMNNQLEFKFMEQYYNSPFGTEKKRERFFEDTLVSGCDMPFHRLFKGDSFKDLPLPILHALAFGPVVFAVRDHLSDIQLLDEDHVQNLVEGCWDAVRKH